MVENNFSHIRWPLLNVTIFITHVRNCVMGATPMETMPMVTDKSKPIKGRPYQTNLLYLVKCSCIYLTYHLFKIRIISIQ